MAYTTEVYCLTDTDTRSLKMLAGLVPSKSSEVWMHYMPLSLAIFSLRFHIVFLLCYLGPNFFHKNISDVRLETILISKLPL